MDMFNFSLEGFTGVRIFITFTVTIYYSERIQIKISQKRTHRRESRRNQT